MLYMLKSAKRADFSMISTFVNLLMTGKSSAVVHNATRPFLPDPRYMRAAGSICGTVGVTDRRPSFPLRLARYMSRLDLAVAPVFGEAGRPVPRNTRAIDELDEVVQSGHESRCAMVLLVRRSRTYDRTLPANARAPQGTASS
jgi:hypothetical protein